MNQNKHKEAKLYSALLFLFFCICGCLLIYRGSTPMSKLKKIEGKLIKYEVRKGFGNFGTKGQRNYAIIIEIEGQSKYYGIYAGTNEQAKSKYKKIKLDVGKIYSFFIDPTVTNVENVNLGIRLIKFKNNTLYKEVMKSHVFFGWLFIILGILSGLIFYVIGKRKFG